MVRIDAKYLMVAPLGLGEVPRAMAAERRREHPVERGTERARRRDGGILSLSRGTAALPSIHACLILVVWLGSNGAIAKIKFRQIVPLRGRRGGADAMRR